MLFLSFIFTSCHIEGSLLKAFQLKQIKNTSDLYRAIQHFDTDEVMELINKGADPNYCKGEIGWVESNPLGVLSWYNTRHYFGSTRVNPDPLPDIAIFNILVNAGADINRRPYIWSHVNRVNNEEFEHIIRHRKINHESMDESDIIDEELQLVDDVNRLIKCFLSAGADPDKLGHPYPYSNNLGVLFLNDKKADKYFSKGTRAINEAIEKGILWERQVDLLLQYTKLDKESLEAAKRSNDPDMIEKINKLWELQQATGVSRSE